MTERTISLKNFLKYRQQNSDDFYLSGVRGSSKVLAIAKFLEDIKSPALILTPTYEKAEEWLDDLTFFDDRQNFYFFPQWDTLPYDSFSPQKEVIGNRFRALKALQGGAAKAVITTPHALMQCFMPPQFFSANSLTLQGGQSYDRAQIEQRLLSAGYVAVDRVEEPGEYRHQGEFTDIYGLTLKYPVRVDWKKNKIQSFQKINVETQLSEVIDLAFLVISPAQEILLTDENRNYSLQQINKFSSQMNSETLNLLRAYVEKMQHFPGIEAQMGMFFAKPATLLDYFPKDSLLVIDEIEEIQNKAENIYQEIYHEYELNRQQGNFVLPPENNFSSPRELLDQLQPIRKIYCSETREEKNSISGMVCSFLDNRTLKAEINRRTQNPHTSTQMIIDQMISWQAEGSVVLISAKNQTHAEHLKEILGDFDVNATLSPTTQTCRDVFFELEQLQSKEIVKKTKEKAFGPPFQVLAGAITEGFRYFDEQGVIRFALMTETEIFGEKTKARLVQHAKVQQFMGTLDDLHEGDHVVHLDYGIGQYQGLKRIEVQGHRAEFMVLSYARNEKVYVPVDKFHLIQKYVNADGSPPTLHKLGEKSWKKTKAKVEKAVEDIAHELVEIYSARKANVGFAFKPDNNLTQEFDLAFPYEETEDQLVAIQEVKADMESSLPMDRLVCGDVGFGKTEIAMRAAFKAVSNDKQVCILVPTTILAQQHWVSFNKRFEGKPLNIEVISRFRSNSEQKDIIERLKEGRIDILIGTHRLLSADVQFKDLGLLIVDEEQRFGVKHKEKIKRFRTQVDVLTLSATPIPRTLYMSLMGIRDLSIINTPPRDRLAIRTRYLKTSEYIIQEAVSRELRRGGQVFIVHNRVETIYDYLAYLKNILPNVKIVVGHGQLSEHELERVMMDFIQGEYDILLSTTIIESGLDIPRANTIIINNAHQFGLAQLYQLRGRVGRSNLQAYAYLLVPQEKVLTQLANERLSILQELNDLGVGFKIASRDLELRGAGNILGSEQSGNIDSVGLELYTQMIDRAVKKLSQDPATALPDMEIKIDLDLDLTLSEDYIAGTSQRLSLYKKLAAVRSDAELWKLREDTENRFGLMPGQVVRLFQCVQARLLAARIGISNVEHRGDQLKVIVSGRSKLNPEKLVLWLQQPQSALRFIPENTLLLKNVPANMGDIIDGMKKLEEMFA